MMDEENLLEPDAEDEVIVLSDEDGNDVTFRVQGHMELDGRSYLILEDVEDEGSVLIFVMEEDENGEEVLNPVEDEDECQRVFDYFQADFDDYEFCDAE